MKAYKLYNVSDLRYCDCEIPLIPDDWALVKVKAAGICSSDIPRIFKKGTYHFPTIPGHEFSGVVCEVSNKKNNSLVGKRVGVFPLIPCRNCESCKIGNYETCENYDYIGSRRDGGFAEYVAAPVWNIVTLDDGISFEAAAMLEPASVAIHAVKAAEIKMRERVAIIGTGTIGFIAAQFIKNVYDVNVSIIGRNNTKRMMAENIFGINYILESDDLYGQFDVVIEAVGSAETVNQAIKYSSVGGTVVLMGNPVGDIQFLQDNYWQILRKQITIKGTWNSSYEKNKPSDWTDAVEAILSGKIKPEKLITHSFMQQDLKEGLELMHVHKEAYCKVMTLWNR